MATCSPLPGWRRYSASISRQNGYPCWPCGPLRSTTAVASCLTGLHASQRVRPWIAFACAGSVRASWNSTPSKTYRPPSILFGQGASSLPAPPGGSSSASYPAITGWPRNSSSRRPAPSSVTWRGRDLRRSGTAARSLPRSWRLRVRPGAAGGAPPAAPSLRAAPLSSALRCGGCGRPGGSLLVDGGDWLGDLFEGFAGGLDAEEGFDQAADDHDGGADQVAPEQGGAGSAGADQRAVEEGAERAGDRADGEEDRDRLGADLDRPGFTDGVVGGTGAGGGEEEDDDPHDGLRGRVEDLGVEQDRREGQQNARDDVGAGDHLLAAPGVKQRPQDQRPAQVADGKRQPIQRDLVRGHVVEVDQ